jgi:membrane protease YdiL (CAAX protease family)
VDDKSVGEWLETLPERKSRAVLALTAGLMIGLAYVATRFVIYQNFPLRTGQMTYQGGHLVAVTPGVYWWMRDTIMDVPRVIAFGLTMWAGRYFWDLDDLGWHARRWRLGLVWGSIGAALIIAGSAFSTTPYAYPSRIFAVLALSSVVVALFEEALFRGLLFNALYDLGGRHTAIYLSAALFAVYHVQAQPIEGWPAIFAMGVLYGVLRWQGVGLVWLVASHALGDALFFLGGDGPSYVPWWPVTALALKLSVPAAYFIRATRAPVARQRRHTVSPCRAHGRHKR